MSATYDRNHERIENEARALTLVSTRIKIPVPRLIEHGTHKDGRKYLSTEIVEGITLNQLSKQGCSFKESHTSSTSCKTCLDQAFSNALDFIQNIVFPELAKLKSRERGLGGFVMPPQWLAADIRLGWKGHRWQTLRLEEAKYVFQHGGLAAHDIIIDPAILEVKALIDWECAGYFLPGTVRWPGTLDSEAFVRRSDQLAGAIAEFVPQDYLDCYAELGEEDKANWDRLVDDGEFPCRGEVEQMATGLG